jgi:uncharacterized protein
MKQGTDRNTGRLISGVPYLWQRRRDFGSRMFEMLDRNVDPGFYMDAFVLLAEAINNPANGLDDFRLSTMRVERPAEHHVEIYLSGYLLDGDGSTPVDLEGIPL